MAVAQEQVQQNAVSLKLPTFWTNQLKVWFQQTVVQFALRQVTADKAEYFYVVAALDQDSAQTVNNFLEQPPAKQKYATLKRRLLDS